MAVPEADDQQELDFDSGGFSKDIELEDLGDERIEEPFDPEQIGVGTRNMTVDLLLRRIKRNAIKLAPDFQRRVGIWTDARQSRLIESMLLRIPIPNLYAAEDEDDSWIIVDGIQRLSAVARFIDAETIGESPLRLRDLEYLDFNGARYEDLPVQLQTRLDETEFMIHLIAKTTPENAKYNLFGRINTGGLPLTPQELRHALIPGRGRTLLKELAESAEFQTATVHSVSDLRMSDREMALRFIAFYRSDPAEYRSPELDDFLREAMKALNDLDEREIADLRCAFARAMRAANRVFGKYAFRKIAREQKWRNPINKALFEAIAVNLAKRSDDELEVLVERRDGVWYALIELLEHKGFNDSISVATGDRAKVRRRFHDIDFLFDEVTRA